MGILNAIIVGIKRIAISAAKGVADPVVAVGAGVKEIIKDNIVSPEGGVGKFDLVRLFSLIMVYTFALAYIFGYISIEELKQIAKLILLF